MSRKERRLAEGHAMTETAKVPRNAEGGRPGRRPLVDDELADQLLGKAQAGGVELLGPDGLLSQLTKAVLERALAEEMTGHLGYDKHDPAGRGSGNSRNGTTPKTLLTDVGAVDLAVPRDRNGSFEPQIVRKGQTRLDGFNERIIALYARGMTVRDIRAHLREMYDVEVSPDLISRVTDGVVEELQEWQSRPLDAVYPVVFTGALMVKIRDGVVTNRAVYLAIGIDCDGHKQVLGLWVGPTTGEPAKFWMSVLSEVRVDIAGHNSSGGALARSGLILMIAMACRHRSTDPAIVRIVLWPNNRDISGIICSLSRCLKIGYG
jgi:hypothetical protein